MAVGSRNGYFLYVKFDFDAISVQKLKSHLLHLPQLFSDLLWHRKKYKSYSSKSEILIENPG